MENQEQNQEQEQEQLQQQELSPQLQEVIQAVESLKQQNQLLQQQLSVQQQQKQVNTETEDAADEVEQSMKDILGLDKATEKAAKRGVEELSNQELVEAMSMAVDQLVQSQRQQATKEVNSTIQSVNKRIEAIQSVVMNLAVQNDIKACKDKYQDFDAHRVDIQKELQSTPGLSIEKAYLLVKASKASQVPSRKATETERPTDALSEALGDMDEEQEEAPQQRQRPNTGNKRTTYTSNVASFRQALDEAVNKVVSARQRKGNQ